MARQATIRIDVETGRAKASLENLEGSLDELDIQAVEAGEGFDRMGASAVEASQQVERSAEQAETALQSQAAATSRVRGTTGSLGTTASSTAAQLSTDLTQSAQDAAFGIENLAASAPFLTEQFQRLQRQSGGTTGALSNLFAALKGPTGVIAAFTLLLTFKDQIVGFFTDTGEAAEDSAEKFNEAADSLIDVGEELEVSDLTIERGERLQRTLEQRQDEISTTVSALEDIAGVREEVQAGVPISQIGTVLDAVEDTELTLQDLEEQGLDLVDERLEERRREQDAVEGALETTENQLSEARALRDVYEELPEDIRETTEAAEGTTNEIRESVENIFQLSENIGRVRGFMRRRRQGTVARGGLGSRFGLTSGRQLGRGARQLGTAIGAARGRQSALRESEQLLRDMGLIDDFAQSLPEAFGRAGQNIDDEVNKNLVRGINLASQLGTTLVQAAQQGGAEFEQVFGAILSTVGQAVAAVNPAAGAALSGAGQIIGSLQHGGTVDTPLQIVGERGPELAALPQGTEVSSTAETRRTLGIDQLVQEVRSLRGDMQTMDLRMDAFRANSEVGAAQRQLEESGDRILPAK